MDKNNKKKGFITALILWAAGFAFNAFLSLKWIKVKEISAAVNDLPEGLNGLKILHISDLHNASTKKMSVNIWKKVLKEDFDIAVITGDMTVSCFDEVLPHEKGLKVLANKAPAFFVDGNHEKTHFKAMQEFLTGIGIKISSGKAYSLDINGEKLRILGVRDYYYQKYYGFAPLDKLMLDEEKAGFRLFLSHQPQIVDRLKDYSGIFVISGHTHGGQVRIPFLPVVLAPGQGFMPAYGSGLYKKGGNTVYVSSGIGWSRIPIRLFNRPEVALITLKKMERIVIRTHGNICRKV